MAANVAEWSKDPSTRVGAVIVGTSREVVAIGYNGFPRGMADCPDLYADRDFKYRHIIHAETNACINALRQGASTVGATIYVTHPPCVHCAGIIKQAGIVHAVFPTPPDDFIARWPMTDTVDHFARIRLKLSTYENKGGKPEIVSLV